MKKFIFGVMLLVSMLGIVGCSNPSNSDGFEKVYTLKNVSESVMTISYRNKSNDWVNKRKVPANGIYEIPANDAKIVTVEEEPSLLAPEGRNYLAINIIINENKDFSIPQAELESRVCNITLNGSGQPQVVSDSNLNK